jgi:hypothetical protein
VKYPWRLAIGADSWIGEAVALVGSVVITSIPGFEMHAGASARLARTRMFRIREKHTGEELTWS